jgi:two-component system C4-dicarboxylate transport sensor histidine kinase DctB
MPMFSDPIGIALGGLLVMALLVAAGVLLERRQRVKWHHCRQVLRQTQADLAAAQSTLSQLRGRLNELQHTSQLAVSVAHEINQPLSALRLLAQQSQAQVTAGPASQDAAHTGLMGRLEHEIDRLVSMTEALHLLLRSQDTRIESVNLARVVQAVLLYHKRPLKLAGVRLNSWGLEQPLAIDGDPQQLQGALTLLLRRALASLAKAPPTNRLLTIHLAPTSSAVELVISDNGPWQEEAEAETAEAEMPAAGSEALDLHVVGITVSNHGGQFSLGRCPELGGRQVRLLLPR